MSRLQLFEFNESSWCPGFIRDSIVETLGLCLRWGRFYEGAALSFRDFVDRTGSACLLDLGSGTGESVAILIDALKSHGKVPPRFLLSDLFPKIGCMQRMKKRYPDLIEPITEPLDARKIPEAIGHDSRTFLTSFHHFTPEDAAGVLSACVASNKAVFVLEPFPKKISAFMPIFFFNMLAYMAHPFMTGRLRLVKFIFTYPVPIIPFFGLWDGLVSLGRMYGRDELMAMVKEHHQYSWEFISVPVYPAGEATVFYGIPKGMLPGEVHG